MNCKIASFMAALMVSPSLDPRSSKIANNLKSFGHEMASISLILNELELLL